MEILKGQDNEVLNATTEMVTDIEEEVLPYVDTMAELMEEAGGIGLAANQVGISKSFFLIAAPPDFEVKVYINPRIVTYCAAKRRQVKMEGCLSHPGTMRKKVRYPDIKVSYQTEDGEVVEEWILREEAHIFQHEMDHLKGEDFPTYQPS